MPHEQPDHVVTLLAEQPGCHAAIDPAGHRQDDSRHATNIPYFPVSQSRYNDFMERETIDRAEAIRQRVLQLRDSL
jgi:hypothetical protein